MFSNFNKKTISRRKFLKIAGTGAAISTISAACAPAPTPTPAPAAQPAAPAAAPAVVAKPFAGKELTVFAGNHHDTNVRDLWAPLFQE